MIDPKAIFVPEEMRHHLVCASRVVASRAYCPHSHYHVGASILTPSGIFEGCNIENSSFGLTICAERVAAFCAVSKGVTKFLAIAISCPDSIDVGETSSKMPCGACRQVLYEFGGPELIVIIDGVGQYLLSELLPQAFELSSHRN